MQGQNQEYYSLCALNHVHAGTLCMWSDLSQLLYVV